MNEGKLIVISGPSGVGKGTALELLKQNKLWRAVSVAFHLRKPCVTDR